MKFEYTFEGMKLKVLDETFAGKVLAFYSRNRDEFDRYEAAKPDNFYTTEYIAATLKAEYAALLKGEFGRFKHMLKILTHEKEMHRIEAYIHPDNISSVNLVKSLGFISEGTAYSYVKLNGSWQDHLRFVYIS